MTTPAPTPTCVPCSCNPACAGAGLTFNTTTQAYDVELAPGGGITLGPTGLAVAGSETIVTAGPGADVTGNGSGATPYVVSSAPSTDAGNLLTLGTDGNHLITCAQVVACPGVVQVVTAGPGTDVTGDGTAATPYVVSAAPSTDAGNTTTLGTDGNLYTPATPTAITAGPGADITGTGAPATPYVISAAPSTDAGNLLHLGADNNMTLVCDDVAACTQIDAGTNVTVTGNGTTATPYVINAAGGGAATVITAGPGVDVTGTGTGADPFVIASPPSTDVGNVITAGADGNLHLDCADIAGCISVQGDPATPEVDVTGTGTLAVPYLVTAPPQVVPRARVRTTADTVIPDDVAGGQAVPFAVSTYDVGTMFNLANPTRLTVPAGWDGIYHMGGNIQFRGELDDNEGFRMAALRINGAIFIAFNQARVVISQQDSTILNLNTDYELVAGDYLELIVQAATEPPGAGANHTGAAAGQFSIAMWMTHLHR